MSEQQQAWPTDLLTGVERRLTNLLADLDRWQYNSEDVDWVINDTRDYARQALADVETAAIAAEQLERAAGRPPMTEQQAVADIADRLTWGREDAR